MLNKEVDEESETTGDVSAESCLLETESFVFGTDSIHAVDVDEAPPLAEVSFGGSSCTTESTASSLETMADTSDAKHAFVDEASDFQVGDHVYTWCSLLGMPRAYSHHGIVIQISKKHVKIIDFYPLLNENQTQGKPSSSGVCAGSASGGSSNSNGRRFTMSTVILDHETARKVWTKVEYSVSCRNSLLRRSGTWSSAASDVTGLVLARIEFLQDNRHILPRYDEVSSNCECVAVWCKTGRFCSLQGISFLGGLATGSHVATAAAAAGVSSATVTVPAAGMWGWFGCTTTVSLATAAPLLVPAIIAGGAAVTAPSIVALWKCKKEWNEITENLNLCLAQGCRQGLYLPHLPRFQTPL